jgi:hypothetical protein
MRSSPKGSQWPAGDAGPHVEAMASADIVSSRDAVARLHAAPSSPLLSQLSPAARGRFALGSLIADDRRPTGATVRHHLGVSMRARSLRLLTTAALVAASTTALARSKGLSSASGEKAECDAAFRE